MDCRDVTNLAIDRLAGEAGEASRRELSAHLATCEPCRAEMARLEDAWRVLGLDPDAAVTPEFRRRTLGLLEEEMMRQRVRACRPRPRLTRPLLQAAALVAAGFLGYLVARGLPSSKTATPTAASPAPTSPAAALGPGLGAEQVVIMSRHASRQAIATDFGATGIVAEVQSVWDGAERRAGAHLQQVVRVGDDIAAYGGMWLMVDEAHVITFAVHPGWRRQRIGERRAKRRPKASGAAYCQASAAESRRYDPKGHSGRGFDSLDRPAPGTARKAGVARVQWITGAVSRVGRAARDEDHRDAGREGETALVIGWLVD